MKRKPPEDAATLFVPEITGWAEWAEVDKIGANARIPLFVCAALRETATVVRVSVRSRVLTVFDLIFYSSSILKYYVTCENL